MSPIQQAFEAEPPMWAYGVSMLVYFVLLGALVWIVARMKAAQRTETVTRGAFIAGQERGPIGLTSRSTSTDGRKDDRFAELRRRQAEIAHQMDEIYRIEGCFGVPERHPTTGRKDGQNHQESKMDPKFCKILESAIWHAMGQVTINRISDKALPVRDAALREIGIRMSEARLEVRPVQERAYRDHPPEGAAAQMEATKSTLAEYAAAMAREHARAVAELRRDEARCTEAMPNYGQRIEQLERGLAELVERVDLHRNTPCELLMALQNRIEQKVLPRLDDLCAKLGPLWTSTVPVAQRLDALEQRTNQAELQLRALNAADERAARDKESPAEAEAAETESLAHQIQSLRAQINQVDARRADLANHVRKIADKVKGIGFAAGG